MIENLLQCTITKMTHTMHMWTVNSTPTPTERMSVTAGTALSLMPAKPMKPYTSTVIMAKTMTYKQNKTGQKT